MINSRWGLRKIATIPYPILGANSSVTPSPVTIDIKRYLQTPVLSRLVMRVVGNIVKANGGGGADPGTATGKENPEALMTNASFQTSPSMGALNIDAMSARGLMNWNLFHRGYAILGTDITDAAATVAVDYEYVFNFREKNALVPLEYGLPLSLFSAANFTATFGGREQLFSGGSQTWNLSGLQIEFWADYDNDVAASFHAVEFFERSFPITATQSDFSINNLESGYIYTDLLFRTERDRALVNDIINNITIRSAGREWTPQGDKNALIIQRQNREDSLTDPSATQTGLYYVPCMRSGQFTTALDSLDSNLEVKVDVTSGAGTQVLYVVGRRIIPQKLMVGSPVVATPASGSKQ